MPKERHEEHRELSIRLLGFQVEHDIALLPAPSMVYAVAREFPTAGSFHPSGTPRPIHVLTRGDINKPAEPGRTRLALLRAGLGGRLVISNPNDESARRAALALWLTDDRNAITWRCIVNRVWQYHFGRGLCDTPNDFGKMGASPSHPELLEWLAVWFRDEAKGSIKALHRLIVTSETYRQSSLGRTQKADRDADNRLLSHMNRRRLTAEQVRDSLLQMSGRLDLTMGGPSVVQFVHRGKATFTPEGGAPPFLDYDGFAPTRPRTVVEPSIASCSAPCPTRSWMRSTAPDGSSLTPVRGESTTVFGAFALLNNAFVIRQCEHIAARLNREAEAKRRSLRRFVCCSSASPRPDELARFTDYARRARTRERLPDHCQ